jgi:hypothetical protein
MHSFHQRPLTWLLLIALACLNAVAIATDYQMNWYADLLAAQVLIVGGWLALGRAHRLARAGVFVAVIVASATPDYLMGVQAHGSWRYVLGSIIYMSSATAASCWLCLLVGRALQPEPAAKHTRWQFSVAELLGWMLLVAVAATVVPAAMFRHLSQADSHWMILAAAAGAAGLLMTLFLRRVPGHDLSNAAVAMVAVTAVAILISRYDYRYDYASLLRAYLVVALWVLVQRLDAQRAMAALAGGAPPATVRLFDPDADLEDQRHRLG